MRIVLLHFAFRKAQPSAVAHRLLQLQDGEKFAQIGNPFKVTGGLADAVTLALLLPFLLVRLHAFYAKPVAQFDSFQRWMTLRKSRAQSLLLFNQT